MKKLMALLLALVLSFSLVACGKNTEKDDTKEETKATDKAEKDDKKDAEEEATAVAEGFMDAFMDLDAREAGKYIDDVDAIEDTIDGLKDAFLDGMMSELPSEFDELEAIGIDVEAKLDELADAVLDKFKDDMSYEIIDTEKDGDDYIFTVEMTIPSGVEDVDYETEMADLLSEENLTALAEQWKEDGIIDDNTTEEEAAELLIDELFSRLVDIIEFTTSSTEAELVVVQDGNDWVVDAKESGF